MNKTKVSSICVVCNKEAIVNKAVITAKLPVYCSVQCKKQKHIHECSICKKQFRSDRRSTKVCSEACKTELNNSKVVDVECFRCKMKFKRPTRDVYSGKRIFCSRKCVNAQHSLDNPSRYGTNWTTMRKRALARDGHKCVVCKKEEDLQVHHKIKLRLFENPNDANYIENLITVCEGCHKKIETKDIV